MSHEIPPEDRLPDEFRENLRAAYLTVYNLSTKNVEFREEFEDPILALSEAERYVGPGYQVQVQVNYDDPYVEAWVNLELAQEDAEQIPEGYKGRWAVENYVSYDGDPFIYGAYWKINTWHVRDGEGDFDDEKVIGEILLPVKLRRKRNPSNPELPEDYRVGLNQVLAGARTTGPQKPRKGYKEVESFSKDEDVQGALAWAESRRGPGILVCVYARYQQDLVENRRMQEGDVTGHIGEEVWISEDDGDFEHYINYGDLVVERFAGEYPGEWELDEVHRFHLNGINSDIDRKIRFLREHQFQRNPSRPDTLPDEYRDLHNTTTLRVEQKTGPRSSSASYIEQEPGTIDWEDPIQALEEGKRLIGPGYTVEITTRYRSPLNMLPQGGNTIATEEWRNTNGGDWQYGWSVETFTYEVRRHGPIQPVHQDSFYGGQWAEMHPPRENPTEGPNEYFQALVESYQKKAKSQGRGKEFKCRMEITTEHPYSCRYDTVFVPSEIYDLEEKEWKPWLKKAVEHCWKAQT